jgi:hypothetical protein
MAGSRRGRVQVALTAVALCAAAACVDPYAGSHIEISFAPTVEAPGLPSGSGRPPPDTHFALYGVTLDAAAVGASAAFFLTDFAIASVIDTGSPCFVEERGARLAGLHSTREVEKLVELLSAKYGQEFDPDNPPAGHDPGDVIDVLTARVRAADQLRLQTAVKAVTSVTPASYPEIDPSCACASSEYTGLAAADLASRPIPAPACLSDACSAKRQVLCEAFWQVHPEFYEGSDQLMAQPLNGRFFGAVQGQDPRTGQPLAGARMLVDADLSTIDALLVNWQYNCTIEDWRAGASRPGPDRCEPQVPAGQEAARLGVNYLAGLLEPRARGVLNASLRNQTFPLVTAEVAVLVDLDADHVSF